MGLPKIDIHADGDWHIGEGHGGFYRLIGPSKSTLEAARADLERMRAGVDHSGGSFGAAETAETTTRVAASNASGTPPWQGLLDALVQHYGGPPSAFATFNQDVARFDFDRLARQAATAERERVAKQLELYDTGAAAFVRSPPSNEPLSAAEVEYGKGVAARFLADQHRSEASPLWTENHHLAQLWLAEHVGRSSAAEPALVEPLVALLVGVRSHTADVVGEGRAEALAELEALRIEVERPRRPEAEPLTQYETPPHDPKAEVLDYCGVHGWRFERKEGRCGGAWTFAGSRMTIATIVSLHVSGVSVDRIHALYPAFSTDAIEAALIVPEAVGDYRWENQKDEPRPGEARPDIVEHMVAIERHIASRGGAVDWREEYALLYEGRFCRERALAECPPDCDCDGCETKRHDERRISQELLDMDPAGAEASARNARLARVMVVCSRCRQGVDPPAFVCDTCVTSATPIARPAVIAVGDRVRFAKVMLVTRVYEEDGSQRVGYQDSSGGETWAYLSEVERLMSADSSSPTDAMRFEDICEALDTTASEEEWARGEREFLAVLAAVRRETIEACAKVTDARGLPETSAQIRALLGSRDPKEGA